MNQKLAFEITLKLVILYIKNANYTNTTFADKDQLMHYLQFMMTQFLKIENFETIEQEAEMI